jgi:nicotinamide riboside kinase
MAEPMVIAVLGAESTGKSTLATQLCAVQNGQGHRVALIEEVLREFCDLRGRTPRIDEQAGIASEQTRRILAAADDHDIVVADTTALMIAVYSDWVFGDRSLYAQALLAQKRCNLNLVTALDLPWQADGLQRDGPHVREPVDELLRAALRQGGIGFSVVGGVGPDRLAAALEATRHARGLAGDTIGVEAAPRWQWLCERCGDAECERHLLPRG